MLLIDADVIPPKDVITKLMALDHPLVGGIVPGRGCHSHMNYIFGEQIPYTRDGIEVIEVGHGTCGCMMIRRDVLNQISFRYGKDDSLSEDPAFALDVRTLYGERMLLRKDVICEHVGELKENEVAQW